MKPACFALVVATLCAAGAAGAPGEPGPAKWRADAPLGAFARQSPTAKTLAAAEWVRPGMRVSIRTLAVSERAEPCRLRENPKGPWVEPATGRRFRIVEGGMPSPGVATFREVLLQYDVVSVGENAVAVHEAEFPARSIQFHGQKTRGLLLHAAGPDDLWVHPAALEEIAAKPPADTIVLRGRTARDGREVEALSFVSAAGDAFRADTFELETGLRLSTCRHEAGGALLRTTLAGVRQRAPLRGSFPEWVKTGRGRVYAGSLESATGEDPLERACTVRRAGPDWALLDLESSRAGRGKDPSSEMAGPLCSWWCSPEILGALDAGEVLDEDPLTGIRVKVEEKTAEGATISWKGPDVEVERTYLRDDGELRLETILEVGISPVLAKLWRTFRR